MTSLRMKPTSSRIPCAIRWRSTARSKPSSQHAQGRFGNNVRQIGTAVCLARQLGIRRVYLCKLPLLEIARAVTFDDVTVLPESSCSETTRAACSAAHSTTRRYSDASIHAGYRHIAEAARAVGQPIFHRLAAQSRLVPDATDLAIHLRAGDIFARDTPHPLYVQPPFAFYRYASNLRARKWGSRVSCWFTRMRAIPASAR